MNSTTCESIKILVVDIQGFKLEKNKFIPKELAAYDGKQFSHYIFNPPFSFNHLSKELKQQAEWLMKNHHCIDWNEGFTPHHQFKSILNRLTLNVDIIYVKGGEKKKYLPLEKISIMEFEEQPALKPQKPMCFYHSKPECMCALTNVFQLYNNFIMNID
jgi:hypothetical protein